MKTDKLDIYEIIKSIADKLAKSHNVFTRADLAFELKPYGINSDSYEVSKLVREAYEHFGDDENIRTAFLNNDQAISIVDDLEIESLILSDVGKSFDIMTQRLEETDAALNDLEALVKGFTSSIVSRQDPDSNFLKTILGTRGVSKVASEAANHINAYTVLVDSYHNAKSEIQRIAQDFVAIRSGIAGIYREYALKLVDLYGDSVKSVAPELFDFESIQYLDIDNMLENIRLEYEHLSENCATLMDDIKEDFSSSVGSAAKGYKKAGGGTDGLIMAGLTMVSHYLDASEQTTQREKEWEMLKRNIKHDVTLIEGDFTRLNIIYNTINDLYIPKANAFYKFCNTVLSDELKGLFDALYSDTETRALMEEREAVLREYKEMESRIADNQLQIDYYSSNIEKVEALLASKQTDYDVADILKPKKPNFLINILTFGYTKTSYNRKIYEWNQDFGAIVREYENYKVDIKLDKDELAAQQKDLGENIKSYDEIDVKLKALSIKLRKKIVANSEIKNKMTAHLESLIRLLNIAKEILESKIDDKYINTINITDYRSTELSDQMIENINNFAEYIKAENAISMNELAEENALSNLAEKETTPEQALVEEKENETIEKGLSLIKQWAEIQAVKKESKDIFKSYDNELQQIQSAFNEEISRISDESLFLNEILKVINLAENKNELKDGLLMLGKSFNSLSSQDIEDFIAGNKQIEI